VKNHSGLGSRGGAGRETIASVLMTLLDVVDSSPSVVRLRGYDGEIVATWIGELEPVGATVHVELDHDEGLTWRQPGVAVGRGLGTGEPRGVVEAVDDDGVFFVRSCDGLVMVSLLDCDALPQPGQTFTLRDVEWTAFPC
jgi:hypothetical protein